ncbi:hypothetical protein PROFUN_12646 [Planoprotostelium fungivorum]|uniref:ATP synthase F1 complex delta/epsilon subunit N-terminal domain-containing protein n=1 Tax=Planoprotostelium fungivorum TaxID=1890364 RepID=A0A2P6N759_9EUKA|nr:hypothetical protein PROFUN_12646 [Planoprotostelium fungivorum]
MSWRPGAAHKGWCGVSQTSPLYIMLAGRILRTTFGRTPVQFNSRIAPLRRGYADAAPQLKLTFAAPHQVFVNNQAVQLVQVPGVGGEFGIVADHIPTIAELAPGVVTVTTDKEQKWFISGGFAFVRQNSEVSVNVVEAFPLDQLSAEAAKDGLKQASDSLARATTEEEKAKAQIEVEVYTALVGALGA